MTKAANLATFSSGPAFSVSNNGTQTISAVTHTKLQFPTERFDTANAFDSTTNNRFQPQVAGYYQIQTGVYFNISAGQTSIVSVYLNSSSYCELQRSNSLSPTITGSNIVYLNGSTDYIEIYAYSQSGSVLGSSSSNLFWFSGSLIRAA